MAVEKAHQQLFHKMLHLGRGQGSSVFVKVLLHIYVEIVEDEVELVLAMGNVLQLNDVRVLQLLQ